MSKVSKPIGSASVSPSANEPHELTGANLVRCRGRGASKKSVPKMHKMDSSANDSCSDVGIEESFNGGLGEAECVDDAEEVVIRRVKCGGSILKKTSGSSIEN